MAAISVNPYESEARRPLTFAERRVNLVSIRDNSKRMGEKMDQALNAVKADILAGGPPQYDFAKKLTDIVTEIQKEAFDFGKQTASAEMEVKVKATDRKVEGVMYKQNAATIKQMLKDIADRYYQQDLGPVNFSEAFSETGILSQFFNGLKSLFVFAAINLGREAVFEANPEKVYAIQFSAILDNRTTTICRGLDGVIVKPGSDEYLAIRPPRHWGCRSILVEIMVDEPYKPLFTKSEKIPTDLGTPPSVEALETWRTNQQKLLDAQNG